MSEITDKTYRQATLWPEFPMIAKENTAVRYFRAWTAMDGSDA
jgi:hypothetical protein